MIEYGSSVSLQLNSSTDDEDNSCYDAKPIVLRDSSGKMIIQVIKKKLDKEVLQGIAKSARLLYQESEKRKIMKVDPVLGEK